MVFCGVFSGFCVSDGRKISLQDPVGGDSFAEIAGATMAFEAF
jgi:hypothetical protein